MKLKMINYCLIFKLIALTLIRPNKRVKASTTEPDAVGFDSCILFHNIGVTANKCLLAFPPLLPEQCLTVFTEVLRNISSTLEYLFNKKIPNHNHASKISVNCFIFNYCKCLRELARKALYSHISILVSHLSFCTGLYFESGWEGLRE